MSKPLISIIVPCFNAESTIANTINSILMQTYSNIEIIIVDDASSDNSLIVCQKFSIKNQNIKIIKHETNKGQTITRNDGINFVNGEWMLFLDSDDILPTYTLDNYVDIIDKWNPDIIFSGYETSNIDGVKKQFLTDIPNGLYSSKTFGNFLFSELKPNILTCIGSKLYKTEFVRKRKDYTSDNIKTNWDMAFVMDALISCDCLYFSNMIGYTYQLRKGSITYSYRTDMYKNICDARRRIKEYLLKCDCYEEKKIEYHLFQYELIKKSLLQEIKYKKGFKVFKKTLKEISEDKLAQETTEVIVHSSVKNKYKLIMKLVNKNSSLFLYLIYNLLTKL